MEKTHKKYIHFMPGIIVVIIFFTVYILKGIYPFGEKTVVKGDLNLYIDTITFILNIIKDNAWGRILFTHASFSGNINIGIMSWLNPFSLIYLLCFDASKLIYFMSYVIVIKFILIIYSSYYLFYKLFGRENDILNVLGSVLYSFSAYALINYSTLLWMDIIIIFPFLILSLKRIFSSCKFSMYSILLALCMIVEYQLTYMILFSIVTTSLIAIKLFNIQDKKKVVLSLGIGTILGIVISSVYFYPRMNNYLHSSRISANIIVNSSFWSTKLSYLLLSSIMLFAVIKAFKYRKEDKNIVFLLCAIILTGIIPVLFEGVNLIWHGGQYDSFPFRYGFIPLFYMNLMTIYYLKNYAQRDFPEERKKQFYLIDGINGIVSLVAISFLLNMTNAVYQVVSVILIFMVYYDFFMYLLYSKIFKGISKENINACVLGIVILESALLSVGLIGIDLNFTEYEHSDQANRCEISIQRDLGERIHNNDGYRYKNTDNLLLETSMQALDIPSVESWTLSDQSLVYAHDKLGYSRLVMRLRSSGGTLLSDKILGNRYIFSKNDLNSELYTYLDETKDNIKLYEINSFFPFGIVYESQNNIEKIPEELDVFDTQNWIYHNLFGKKDDILQRLESNIDYERSEKNLKINENGTIDFQKDEGISDYYLEYKISIPQKGILYMLYDGEYDNYIYCTFQIEIWKNNEWTQYGLYPNYFNNGIIDLGTFTENETASIRLNYWRMNKNLDLDSIKFGLLDLEKLEQLNEDLIATEFQTQENHVNVFVNSPNGNKCLFLPLVYDENIVATNNGKEIKIQRAMNGLISIPLEKGENIIELTYTNPNIKIGLVITLVGIMILIICTLFREPILNIRFLQNIAYIVFVLVTIVFYLYGYGYGIISTFI